MSGLKVIALISGGKDSFFSILHCLANGHEVVALANLHPPVTNGQQSEDLDSFMYQTVGHAIIPLYEEALGLPLYRQAIIGSAVDQNKSYSSTTGAEPAADETESLVPLLQRVLLAHPEANAISTGAILSDYQRTRVESVALRLGLTPLSYLWQYPFLPPYAETSLLDDMRGVGQDARIIKVASGGLDEGFLWANVADPRTKGRLVKAMQRFGTSGDGGALGEGGEFETLAVDGPWPLWKGKIVVEETDRVVEVGDAGVASLRFKTAKVVPKDDEEDFLDLATVLERLRKPLMLDDKFSHLLTSLRSAGDALKEPKQSQTQTNTVITKDMIDTTARWTTAHTGHVITVSNCDGKGLDAGEQMRDIMHLLHEKAHIEPSTIVFTTILLRDMSEFASVNAAYGAAFTTPNPPARVTIACGDTLPAGVDVSLSIVALKESASVPKQGLHVQSRSYWAPANIGPYSQAITVPTLSVTDQAIPPSLVYIAGQIPLAQASMAFPERGSFSAEDHFQLQAVLALQHLWRIGQVTNVRAWLGAVAFIARDSEVSASARVDAALGSWKLANISAQDADSDEEDDDDVDLWDRTHGRQQTLGGTSGTLTMRPNIEGSFVPPCFVAEVEELPRSAPIEWASMGATSLPGILEIKGTFATIFLSPSLEHAKLTPPFPLQPQARKRHPQAQLKSSAATAPPPSQAGQSCAPSKKTLCHPSSDLRNRSTTDPAREPSPSTRRSPFLLVLRLSWRRQSYHVIAFGMLRESLSLQSWLTNLLERGKAPSRIRGNSCMLPRQWQCPPPERLPHASAMYLLSSHPNASLPSIV